MIRSVVLSVVFALTVTIARADPAVSVNLQDLNPSDPNAARVLKDRVQMAAEKACGPTHYTADTRFSALSEADSDHRTCIRYAIHRAMVRIQVERPDLARASDAHTRLAGQ
jgi:UrcA family protein